MQSAEAIALSSCDGAAQVDAIKLFLELIPRLREQVFTEAVVVCQGQHVVQGEVAHDGQAEPDHRNAYQTS